MGKSTKKASSSCRNLVGKILGILCYLASSTRLSKSVKGLRSNLFMRPINQQNVLSQRSTTLHPYRFCPNLSHHRARSRTLISPRRRQHTDRLVVPRETMNAGFDEDEAEFGVLVFTVALEVLTDGDRLVDTHQLPILSPKTHTESERGQVV